MADYYDILEVAPDANVDEIKAQYRFLVQAWHPDKFASLDSKNRAEERLKKINAAYAVLKDPEKREFYDRELRYAKSEESGSTKVDRQQPDKDWAQAAESARKMAEKRVAEEAAQLKSAFESQKRRMAALNLQLIPGVLLSFVRVPAGEFLMGSETFKDQYIRQDEKPAHIVKLPEYLIGQVSITNQQYQVFLQSTGYGYPLHWLNGIIPDGREDHPVVNVSWMDANEFCKWVSSLFTMKARLPSEAEWEKAARGQDGRIYPWGNQPPQPAWGSFYCDSTGPVGSSLEGMSPYGALDMVGNTWEWVNDFYNKNYYQNSPYQNPTGPIWGEQRVLRGGSFSSTADLLRATCRNKALPSGTYDKSIGFRCALSI